MTSWEEVEDGAQLVMNAADIGTSVSIEFILPTQTHFSWLLFSLCSSEIR